MFVRKLTIAIALAFAALPHVAEAQLSCTEYFKTFKDSGVWPTDHNNCPVYEVFCDTGEKIIPDPTESQLSYIKTCEKLSPKGGGYSHCYEGIRKITYREAYLSGYTAAESAAGSICFSRQLDLAIKEISAEEFAKAKRTDFTTKCPQLRIPSDRSDPFQPEACPALGSVLFGGSPSGPQNASSPSAASEEPIITPKIVKAAYDAQALFEKYAASNRTEFANVMNRADVIMKKLEAKQPVTAALFESYLDRLSRVAENREIRQRNIKIRLAHISALLQNVEADSIVADLNRDGRQDIVLLSSHTNTLEVYLRNEQRRLVLSGVYEISGTPALSVVDTNSDSIVDIQQRNGADVKTLLGRGNGTFFELGSGAFVARMEISDPLNRSVIACVEKLSTHERMCMIDGELSAPYSTANFGQFRALPGGRIAEFRPYEFEAGEEYKVMTYLEWRGNYTRAAAYTSATVGGTLLARGGYYILGPVENTACYLQAPRSSSQSWQGCCKFETLGSGNRSCNVGGVS